MSYERLRELELIPANMGERQGTPVIRPTYRDTKLYTLTFTHDGKFGVATHLNKHWHRGENKVQRERAKPNRGSNPEPSCCEAKVLTTANYHHASQA